MAFFHRFPICKLVWLMVVPGAWAQSTTSVVTAKSAAPALPLAPVNTNGLAYVSVFAQYQAYAEQAVSSWPQANATVERLLAQPLQLSAEVVDQVTLVRQAWVRAVVAQQTLVYTQQVNTVAQSSAELAQRMQAVGNQHLAARTPTARSMTWHAITATRCCRCAKPSPTKTCCATTACS